MVGGYATQTPWSDFAAFAILVAAPVSLVYFVFQRYIVSGLAVGGVKLIRRRGGDRPVVGGHSMAANGGSVRPSHRLRGTREA